MSPSSQGNRCRYTQCILRVVSDQRMMIQPSAFFSSAKLFWLRDAARALLLRPCTAIGKLGTDQSEFYERSGDCRAGSTGASLPSVHDCMTIWRLGIAFARLDSPTRSSSVVGPRHKPNRLGGAQSIEGRPPGGGNSKKNCPRGADSASSRRGGYCVD